MDSPPRSPTTKRARLPHAETDKATAAAKAEIVAAAAEIVREEQEKLEKSPPAPIKIKIIKTSSGGESFAQKVRAAAEPNHRRRRRRGG